MSPERLEINKGNINKDKYKDFIYVTKKNHKQIDEIQCEVITISISSKLKDEDVEYHHFSNANIIGCDDDPHIDLKYKVKVKKRRIIFIKRYLFIPSNNNLEKRIIFYYDENLKNLYLEKIIEIFTNQKNKKTSKTVKKVKDFGKISFDEYLYQ